MRRSDFTPWCVSLQQQSLERQLSHGLNVCLVSQGATVDAYVAIWGEGQEFFHVFEGVSERVHYEFHCRVQFVVSAAVLYVSMWGDLDPVESVLGVGEPVDEFP